MGDETIRTGVDDLLTYLTGKEKVAMQDAATALGVPLETMQAWTGFLVEEKILGIVYKFTKPFIYLNKEEKPKKKQVLEHTTESLDQVKQEYADHARVKQIPDAKIPELWRAHVQEALAAKKAYFLEQASRRNVANPLQLWEEYQKDLMARC
jgi:hypothetical protein